MADDASPTDVAATDAVADGTGDAAADAGPDAVDDTGPAACPAKAANVHKVYGGTTSPALLGLTPGQQKALVALRTTVGEPVETTFCSGTLVAPRVVLSAAHCFYGFLGSAHTDQVKVAFGPDSAAPEARVDVQAFAFHPDYDEWAETGINDVSVVLLAEDATLAVPGVEPIPFNTSALTTARLVGWEVLTGGFGNIPGDEDNTARYWTREPVTGFGYGEFIVDGGGETGLCYGDSGGPALFDFGHGVRVLGVESWGSDSCVDDDHFASLTVVSDWVLDRMATLETCAGLGTAGACRGEVVFRCEDGEVAWEDCGQKGQVCGVQGAAWACVDDPCGGETWTGRCDGTDAATWCADGALVTRSCAVCGGAGTCARQDAAVGFYCEP